MMEVPVDEASLFFPSCGKQSESVKASKPQWTMPKTSRDDAKKVHVSNKHAQDLLGRDSPGFAYEPRRQKELPSWGFGTAPARPSFKQQYPEPSNDLLGRKPDYVKFKYGLKKPIISTCPRHAASNAPDLNAFPAGTISPGPQRYSPQSCPPQRLAHAPSIDHVAPKYTMRVKTNAKDLVQSTGEKVGPGSYPHPEACTTQTDSTKPTKPQWPICKNERFPEKRKKHDSYRLWDGEGKRKEQFSRQFSAPPSFSFGSSQRRHAQRLAPCLTALDKGPAGSMGHTRVQQPQLPPRKDTIKFSDVHGG